MPAPRRREERDGGHREEGGEATGEGGASPLRPLDRGSRPAQARLQPNPTQLLQPMRRAPP
jgi:hypothetical protein